MQSLLRSAAICVHNAVNNKKRGKPMQEDGSSLGNQAFGISAENGLIVAYQSHQDALRFLASSLGHQNGVALLQGPAGSGKSTIVNEQRAWSSRESAVAMIDGAHLTPRHLLTSVMTQLDIKTESQQDEQLLQQLSSFLSQQASTKQAPVLIIDNAELATPSALRLLNWFAALEARSIYALRIVLTGQDRLTTLLQSDGMRSFARRHPPTYSLNPLSPQEAMIYLRTRHIAAGGERSEKVFPVTVCEKLHELSKGWPGSLNRCALKAMERMTELRSARRVPRIVVSRDGKQIAEYDLTERQHLIGRTELADIVIEDKFVSKMHAMLQVYSNAVVLLDLNSTNGTTVNSKVVLKTVLRSDDIIALGRCRLKVENVPAIDHDMDERVKASDTLVMEHLDDVRRSRARRTLKSIKNQST